jgi:hypothetical protein
MNRLRIPLNGRPCGKVRYHGKPAADGVAQALVIHERSRGWNREGKPIGVYWCEACGAWHVGHRRVTGSERTA